MAQDTTVIEHLVQGRQALEREMARLTEAMSQLDSVIALFESSAASSSLSGTSPLVRSAPNSATSATVSASTEPRSQRRPAKKATRTTRDTSDAPKSIREHVLDMLAAENRDFGLAEIIDRIHGLGIQAHDDAVRSITIKLMKDGQVERVGRGQYRLAGGARKKADAAASDAASPDAAAPDASAPDASPNPSVADETSGAQAVEVETAAGTLDTTETTAPDDAPQDKTEADEPVADEQPEPQSSYAPPLNLGQPWN